MSALFWICSVIVLVRVIKCEEYVVPPDAVLLLGIHDAWSLPDDSACSSAASVASFTSGMLGTSYVHSSQIQLDSISVMPTHSTPTEDISITMELEDTVRESPGPSSVAPTSSLQSEPPMESSGVHTVSSTIRITTALVSTASSIVTESDVYATSEMVTSVVAAPTPNPPMVVDPSAVEDSCPFPTSYDNLNFPNVPPDAILLMGLNISFVAVPTLVNVVRTTGVGSIDIGQSTTSITQDPAKGTSTLSTYSVIGTTGTLAHSVKPTLTTAESTSTRAQPTETPTALPTLPPSDLPYRCPARSCKVCSRTVIDCSNIRLRELPRFEGNYTDIVLLNLSFNQLTDLPENAFNIFSSVTRLELHSNLIAYIHSRAFFGLKTLEFLTLDDNQLTFLTPVFGGLVSLQRLLLHQNKLTGIQSNTFGHLVSLKILTLHENRFTYLNSSWFVGLTALQSLYLHDNQLNDLTNSPFEPLSSLRTLYLTNNSIEVIKQPYFEGLVNLQTLHLSLNRIREVEYRGMKPLQNLQYLYIIGNQLNIIRSVTFSDLIGLRVLYASNNGISAIDRGAFFRLGLLQRLDLSENKMVQLNPNSLSGLGSLDFLDLSSNKLKGVFTRTFYASKKLRSLYLTNNSISCIEPRALEGTNMIVLYLGRNSLETLRSDMFEGVPTLQAIYLYYNNITVVPRGVFDLLPQLQVIMLTFNQISMVEEAAFQSPPLRTLFWDYQGTPGNEYDCDCNAQWMWKFLNSSAIATSVTCTSPAKYAGRLLASLEYEELVCGSDSKPSLTVLPDCSNVYVRPGQCVKLKCIPHPFMHVSWIKINGDIPQGLTHTGSLCQQGCSSSSPYDLVIPNTNAQHSGQYMCIGWHKDGTTTTKTCKVTVGIGPFFREIPQDITLTVPGPAVVFEVYPGGQPVPNITWFRNGQRLQTGLLSKYQQTASGALILTSTVAEDAGRYIMELSNPFGATQYTVELQFRRSDPCGGRCKNGGVCDLLPSCQCTGGYTGTTCGIPPVVPLTTPPTNTTRQQETGNKSAVVSTTKQLSTLSQEAMPTSSTSIGQVTNQVNQLSTLSQEAMPTSSTSIGQVTNQVNQLSTLSQEAMPTPTTSTAQMVIQLLGSTTVAELSNPAPLQTPFNGTNSETEDISSGEYFKRLEEINERNRKIEEENRLRTSQQNDGNNSKKRKRSHFN